MTYPIVLAHGIARFDQVWREGLGSDDSDDPNVDRLHYFKGIRTMLRAEGYDVYHSTVPWADGVKVRASKLKENIVRILNDSGAEKVNIIAHSMGGLDARHMLFDDREVGNPIHEKVASLTTISTPHHGTSFADVGEDFVDALIALGLEVDGFKDLTTEACRAFNEDPEVEAFEARVEGQVEFRTYAGRQGYLATLGILKVPYSIIRSQEGDNDGLVSVKSAKWKGRYFKGFLEEADHLNELGWWDLGQLLNRVEGAGPLLRRVHDFYRDIASELP